MALRNDDDDDDDNGRLVAGMAFKVTPPAVRVTGVVDGLALATAADLRTDATGCSGRLPVAVTNRTTDG